MNRLAALLICSLLASACGDASRCPPIDPADAGCFCPDRHKGLLACTPEGIQCDCQHVLIDGGAPLAWLAPPIIDGLVPHGYGVVLSILHWGAP